MGYDVSDYTQNGIVMPIRVLSEERAGELADQVMAVRQSGDERAELSLQRGPHYLYPWLFELATSDAVLDAVEKILGPNILIWSSQFFMKDPGDGGYVSWHQDSTYWGLEPNTVTTAWIALTPSTVESGCMKVAPGTHLQQQLPHVDTFDEGNMLSRGQEVQVDASNLTTADVILKPGEMSLHHVQLVHGSDPNVSSWPRLGFVVRYIPTSVRQVGGRTRAVLARGEDTFNHFELTPAPDGELTELGWQNVTDASERMNAILMQTAGQPSQHTSHQS